MKTQSQPFRFPRRSLASLDEQPSKQPSAEVVAGATNIVQRVREGGKPELLRIAGQLGDLDEGPLILGREELEACLERTPESTRQLLERSAARIRAFARAQLECLRPLDCSIPGGRAGHDLAPVESVGAYAPGGRYPLYSSVLMCAIPAAVAGVPSIYLASPRADERLCAAAAIAGVRGVLRVGGAQAIAALAYGVDSIPACHMIVGPGNSWVTAAKALVQGERAIDQLAGPSELVVLASGDGDPATIAADLIAQAEHDTEARALLISDSEPLIRAVESALAQQLSDLPTRDVASRSLEAEGGSVLVPDMQAGRQLCDRLAPEHLSLQGAQAEAQAAHLKHFGALFLGRASSEAAADYGAGPNHVLPTGGGARTQGGLSPLSFLRLRTWMRMDEEGCDPASLRDFAELARLEGLEGHARSLERRLAP